MESERILRTSIFGGFKREDVLKYVEELKTEIAALHAELQEKGASVQTLTQKVDELSAVCEQAKETEKKLEETDSALQSAKAQAAAVQAENESLKKQVSSLDETKAYLEKRSEEVRASEAQLGAAFLDARKYSDEIVTAANKKANETQTEASDSIAKQASEVARLSSDVDALAASFTKSIESLHADISALSAKLSKAAQALANRKDAEKFVPDISIHIAEELGEEIAGITKTDDGSGLTFIHYPPNTEFNEDLNITPNSVYRFDKPKEG